MANPVPDGVYMRYLANFFNPNLKDYISLLTSASIWQFIVMVRLSCGYCLIKLQADYDFLG